MPQREIGCREIFYQLKEDIFQEQNIIRNMEGKEASGEAAGRREEHVIGKWRKDDLVIKWQRTWQDRVLLFSGGK